MPATCFTPPGDKAGPGHPRRGAQPVPVTRRRLFWPGWPGGRRGHAGHRAPSGHRASLTSPRRCDSPAFLAARLTRRKGGLLHTESGDMVVGFRRRRVAKLRESARNPAKTRATRRTATSGGTGRTGAGSPAPRSNSSWRRPGAAPTRFGHGHLPRQSCHSGALMGRRIRPMRKKGEAQWSWPISCYGNWPCRRRMMGGKWASRSAVGLRTRGPTGQNG